MRMTVDPHSEATAGVMAHAVASDDSVLHPVGDPTADASPSGPGTADPNLAKMGETLDTHRTRSIEVTLLTTMAVLYTLYVAREFIVPIVFAVLLNFLLSPIIRRLAKWRISPPVGAALIVLLCIGGISGTVYELSGPANRFMATAPQSFEKAQAKLRDIITPMQRVSQNVERAADVVGAGGGPAKEVVVQSGPSISSRLFGTTQRLIAGMLQVFLLLYFLLAGGDLFLQKLIKVLPHFGDKIKAVEIARATESAVSAYLSTTVIVNIVEGAVVASVLWLLGVPNVLLWGALVAVLELVPYLGAAVVTVLLAIAGLTTFDSLGHAMLVPASFLIINLLQSNVVTPMLLGHRLTLNPVAIFVGLAFFFWIWGVPGAFIAVPVLATFKIFCDHIASMAAIGEFLGQRDDDERRVTARAQPRA